MAKQPVDVATRFVDAINRHALDEIAGLLHDDHEFTDSTGAVFRGREGMTAGWRAYFKMVPDYTIIVDQTFAAEDSVVLLGVAKGTYSPDGRMRPANQWSSPAAWRCVVRDDHVLRWQVFSDNEPIRRLMRESGTR